MIDPPKTYESQAVDFWGGLEDIKRKAKQGKYSSQYDFDTALYEHFIQVHEGHLNVFGCSLSALSFVAQESLVSFSPDGLELPDIYTTGKCHLALSTYITAEINEHYRRCKGSQQGRERQSFPCGYNQRREGFFLP